MSMTRSIALTGMYAALLIGAQFILSTVSGIELVTVLLLCYSYVFGIKRAIALASVFSLARCLFFGFQLHVVILYLIYYNLFALFFGHLGSKPSKKTILRNFTVVAFACIFTITFTLFDNIFTPVFFGFSPNATKAYFFASLYTVVPHTVCTAITVGLFFRPFTHILSKLKHLKST